MTPGTRWTALLPTPLVCGLATLGPVGRAPKAPGTWGSVCGVIWYSLVFHHLDPLGYLLLLALTLYLSVAICGEAEIRLRQRDPGQIVLDEAAAVPLCFLGLQGAINSLGAGALVLLVAGFGLFRLFDVLKPFGIHGLQDKPGGWGVVLDDAAAALATCLVLHLGWAGYVWLSTS